MTGLDRLSTTDGKYALLTAALGLEAALGRRLVNDEIDALIVMMAKALEPKPAVH
ncbi:hypothetical protein [Mesorhizobium sp. CN2-181]|uniref:hypothetical protein n=1 Tax=Mesorhizobium yinganensis TaxID=3157707 RepID=UPI0032B7DC85